MNIDALLARFDGVQKMGANWRARCPACGGKSRKMSIRVVDDGKILLHCFDCSDVAAILQAIGLQASDLFPESLRPSDPIERRHRGQHMRQQADIASWGAALETLELETRIVLIAAGDVINGKPIVPEGMERLRLADATRRRCTHAPAAGRHATDDEGYRLAPVPGPEETKGRRMKASAWEARAEAAEKLVPTPRPIVTFTRLDQIKRKPLDPIIDGYLYGNTITVMFGSSGCCKSFTAKGMCAAVATGTTWMGRRVKQGAVFRQPNAASAV